MICGEQVNNAGETYLNSVKFYKFLGLFISPKCYHSLFAKNLKSFRASFERIIIF